jgi:UDP-GlcNAc:undecaprenyl-phosphate/decaprenyl-phosphate GlcNAc-1-phosphate transferase
VKDYVLTLLVAAAVTYMLTPLVRRLAGRIGAMKAPRDRDVHVVPVPTTGGLAMYAGLVAGLLVADHISVLRAGLANTGMITGLLLAGGLLVVIGFIDDRWGMDVLPKAAGQVAAGGILVATGTSLSWLPLPGGGTFLPDTDQQTVLTILVVVATINAVNFIDGLDGLAAGIVCIAAVSFFLYYYSLSKVIHLSVLAAPPLASAILIGVCLGFLPHNFSPATIFMGDTGSMLLGLLLAYAPISSIDSLPEANLTSQFNRYPVILPLLLPAALLVIPYGDMLLAVVRRTRAGRSPFAPDRKHLHHRLLDIGHSQRASVLIMYLWAAAFSGTVVWLSLQKTVQQGNSNHHGAPIVVFALITVAAVAVLLLLSMPRLRWWRRPRLAAAADTAGAADASPGAAEAGAGSSVLDTPGLAGLGLVGVTAGPAQSGTPQSGTPPFATPPFATPPSSPSTRLPSTGAPSTGLPSTGVGSTWFSSTGLPSTGLPSTGLPSAGRSVVGTPPPAVSGQPPIGRTTHRGAAWRPEASPPPAGDGNETGQDGLR